MGSDMSAVCQFKELCLKLDPSFDDEQIDEALEMIDVTGDGEISFEGAPPAVQTLPVCSAFRRWSHLIAVSSTEFYLWWLDEKGFEDEEEEEPAKEMTLKDRMKLLMKEQEDRQANVKRTDFSKDFSTVSVSRAKESVLSDADARRKINSKTWDIKADLEGRTSTAGAIMSLFSNVSPVLLLCLERRQ